MMSSQPPPAPPITPPHPIVPLNALAQKFKSLHHPGNPILLTNVHDAHTAYLAASHPSTRAIATASFSIAATHGLDDDDLPLSQNLSSIGAVVAGVRKAGLLSSLPISADAQDGYDDVAATVRALIDLGVVGANIEDVDCRTGRLRSIDDACAVIAKAMEAAREAGVPDFVVNARTDVLGFEGGVGDVVERGRRFIDAGATTVFVWGVTKVELDVEMVRRICDGVPGRMVAVQGPGPTKMKVEELRQVGVARISFGPWFWRLAMATFEKEMARLLDS